MPRQHEIRRRLLRGTAFNAAGALLTQMADLITVGILVARLGVAAFGIIVTVLAVCRIAYLLEAGVGQEVVRMTSTALTPSRRSFLSAAAAWFMMIALVQWVFSVTALYVLSQAIPRTLPDGITWPIIVLVIGQAVRLAFGFIPRALVGCQAFIKLRSLAAVRSISTLVLVWTLIEGGRGLGAFSVIALAIELVVASIGIAMMIATPSGTPLLRPWMATRQNVPQLWTAARPMLAPGLAATAGSRIDPLIVGAFGGARATGTYGVASRVFDVLRSAFELIFLGLMPATASLLDGGDAATVRRYLRRALEVAAGLIWPVATVLIIFADRVMELQVGRQLPEVVSTARAALSLVIIVLPGAGLFYVVAGAGRVGDVARSQVAGAVVNVGCGVALVPIVGPAGVFIGSAIGSTVAITRIFRVVADTTGLTIGEMIQTLTRPAVISLAVAAVALVGRTVLPPTAALVTAGVTLAASVVAASWRLTIEVVGLRQPPRQPGPE